jgi:chromosome segregation ATPase
MVFEQTNFIDDSTITKEFHDDTDLQEIQIMTDILHHAGTNPTEKRQIELEVEAWRTYDAMFATERNKLKKELEAIHKQIKEKDQLLKEKIKQIEDLKNQLADLQRRFGGVI